MTSPSPNANSAKAIIRGYLEMWGLLALEGDLDRLIKDGLGADSITLRLQQTDAYKQRFQANEQRGKAGLPVLSPAEYIAAENAYRQVMRSYGLPAEFWTDADDFHKLIARDISPAEVNSRAQAAQQTWLTTDAGVRQSWQSFYGLTDGAAIASILDPDRALPIVQRMATAAQIGGAALRNGLDINKERFHSLADQGIDAAKAQAGFGVIGQTLGTQQSIAERFGQTWEQADAEQATLVGTASAQRKARELAASEQALFDARPAGDSRSLSRRTAGSF